MVDGICPFADEVIVDRITPYDPRTGRGSYMKGQYEQKVGFCDHTAGGFYRTLADPGFWNVKGYSVHFGIGYEGQIVQIVNILDTAWGQGRLGNPVSWPPYGAMGRRSPNNYLISTEHEDARTINGKTVFTPGSQWSVEMYQSDLRLKRWCIEEYRRVMGADLLRFGIDSLAGHHMFDPQSRAECPGRFWRNEYRDRLFNDLAGQGEEEMFTIIREPGVNRAYLLVGKRLEWIPNAEIYEYLTKLAEPEDVSMETFNWLVERHKAAGYPWG